MSQKRPIACAALAIAMGWGGASFAAAAPVPAAPAVAPAPPTIIRITGDLYRAGSRNWFSAFLVTPDGIILVDPTSTTFATWLKGALAERFPGKPVRYVVYTHSHWDHTEGAGVFADTALVVAQEGVLRNMDGRVPHMPGGFVDLDADGAFSVAEVRDRPTYPNLGGVCGSNFHGRLDLDHNGKVTPKEYFSEVRRPDIVYSDRMTLRLGGKTVELIYPGRNHADDGTVVFFPAERTVFSTDFPADALVNVSMRSLPSACGNFDSHPLSEWIRSYRAIEALDFDILAQSHGTVLFKKSDVTEGRRFFEDLVAAVSAGMAQGKSLEELKATIKLEQYKDWAQYPRLLGDDIEAAYRNLVIYR